MLRPWPAMWTGPAAAATCWWPWPTTPTPRPRARPGMRWWTGRRATADRAPSRLVQGLLSQALFHCFSSKDVVLPTGDAAVLIRSEEHTSELQSRLHLVCRLLLGKKTRT